jgi:thioredoxin 1
MGRHVGVDRRRNNKVIEATEETYDEVVAQGSVLVDFWGPRCQPCLAMMPHVETLERQSDGAVRVVKVNAAENQAICRRARVLSLPTYLLIHNGKELDRLQREVSKEDLAAAVERLRTYTEETDQAADGKEPEAPRTPKEERSQHEASR